MTRTGRIMVVTVGLLLAVTLATKLTFREYDFGTSLPGGFPEDVPIVPGTITSCRTARSDDLVRVVEVHIQSGLPFQDVVQFYRSAFATGATEHWNVPEFPLSGPGATETSSNALFGKNTVVVIISATGATTSVLVQVRGTSIFTLPR
jgi:hypothetical protein